MDAEQLRAALEQLRRSSDADMRSRFNRSLSFGDTLFDRWERASQLGFGEGASVYDSALVYGDVSVGEKTWIGPYVLLDGSGGPLTIGAHCSVSAGVHVYTHDTVLWALSAGREQRRTGAVSIGDRCHLGSQAVIAAGVEIGAQSVVGANSFVNRAVPERTIVAGTPARVIGRVEQRGDEISLVFTE